MKFYAHNVTQVVKKHKKMYHTSLQPLDIEFSIERSNSVDALLDAVRSAQCSLLEAVQLHKRNRDRSLGERPDPVECSFVPASVGRDLKDTMIFERHNDSQ